MTALATLALLGLILLYRHVDPPLTPLMGLRWIQGLTHGGAAPIRYHPVPLADVSPALLRAIVGAEDARFFGHHGVDVEAIREAMRDNAAHPGRPERGASTITMQCARNLFLWPARSYLRKAIEAPIAVLLDALWSKRRILEVYVNVIEWGRGIYGAQAAALAYFGVPAADLTAHQAALLAAVLPNPRRWSPAAPTPYVERRAALIMRRAAGIRLDLGRQAAARARP